MEKWNEGLCLASIAGSLAVLGLALAAAGGEQGGGHHTAGQHREQGLPSLFYRCAGKQGRDRLLGLSSQACVLQMCQE